MSEGHTERLQAALDGRYRVERTLGEGGMATVYLAEDVKHRRKVALKVLKPELAAVVGATRFLAEIETTANLQHPHILPLFDSGEADGFLFYVMPYVEGESLREKLDREKQLSVEHAIRIASDVAEALAYAHGHGVIHRDIKPANILIQSGRPVVTDFGIALAVGAAGGGRLTETGLSLGTPHYMSPEQATGDASIGPATDIYALGCVLYEMLVGEPPHTGASAQAILGKIIQGKLVSVQETRPTVPAHVDAAIRTALERLPVDRFLAAEEFRDAIEGKRMVRPRGSTGGAGALAPSARSWWTAGLAAGGGLLAGAALVLLFVSLTNPTSPSAGPTVYGTIALPAELTRIGTLGFHTVVSPDGGRIALAGSLGIGSGVFLRSLGTVSAGPALVEGTEAATRVSGFSPDGEWLLFYREGRIWKVPLAGGGAVPLAEGETASWGDGGLVVFVRGNALWVVAADGGPSTQIAAPDISRGEIRFRTPHVLPGGRAALVTIIRGGGSVEEAVLAIVTLPDGRVAELGLEGTKPQFVLPGYVTFVRGDGSLWAAPFSPRSLWVEGPAVQVLDGIAFTNGDAGYAVSRNGTLVWGRGDLENRLVRVDRSGSARPLLEPGAYIGWPRTSRDQGRIAYTVRLVGLWGDVWYYDLAAGTPTRVTLDGINGRPEWMPDGQRVAFISTPSRGGTFDLHVRSQRWNRSETPDALMAPPELNGIGEVSFGPPGTWMALRTISTGAVAGAGARDIHVARVDSLAALRGFLESPNVAYERPRVSPDGSLLAYVNNVNDQFDVFVEPLSGVGPRVQISTGGGEEPVWSADGGALYYRADTYLYEATMRRDPTLTVVDRNPLFPDVYERSNQRANYDVLGDGFVMVETPRSEQTLSFIVNWGLELARSLGTVR